MILQKPEVPGPLHQFIIRIRCSVCDTVSRLQLVSMPDPNTTNARGLKEIIAGYACDHCHAAIPLRWSVIAVDGHGVHVALPEEILIAVEPFDYSYIPEPVTSDIKEALNCLSVKAHNGFAALCRRAIQSTCAHLGAEGTTRVEGQINELKELAELDAETFAALKAIMLGGHDGAHPQLPAVDESRADLLLQLLRDVMFQLFTRPGLIKEAAARRNEAIQKNRKP